MERKTEKLDEGAQGSSIFRAIPEDLDRLEAALRRIPERQRAILLAVRLDKMSYAEIAKRTGLSIKQVQRQVAKALLRLDDELRGRSPWWRRLFDLIVGESVR